MASFSSAALEKRLTELSNSQQSVQTLSLWMMHHRKHSKAAVEVWHQEFQKARTNKRLSMLYVANDVLQNSKRKGAEFDSEFYNILPDVFQHFAREDSDSQGIKAAERVLSIWEERVVFDGKYVEKLRHILRPQSTEIAKTSSSHNEPERKRKRISSPNTGSGVSGPEPTIEELVRCLSDLEQSASGDVVIRKKISELPKEFEDVGSVDSIQSKAEAEKLLKKVDEAVLLLADYNGRLTAELEDRAQGLRKLDELITIHQAELEKTEKELEKCKTKLATTAKVKKELKIHIESLPDLSLLPDVTGGLAPLPAANDLFSSS
ncbi:Regulation of nuclear pre-mRNA domain-containing protein 1B [Trichoplax sp. H2]|uniref:CID domain-containing protein n=1 Tax=Trichoplax adhaerens TaxID=10228 RepID=B3RJ18_TRIAD|nr:hypothetical protein TRIADDRAFT_63566 [Trichoplax adhaerens]EDV29787.1 hypothetical protein TRIADDRAFT_63566 [Trichoplax adhaerens]RDD47149.1 Regulation of nuclear pre-mRNA domain-containing protein 1B [Trichoplax sp. H2]|eukprot:XP_002108989.1 hypothetical protein TRIADDRAFT_63566 [Trichoplax adhaerens]